MVIFSIILFKKSCRFFNDTYLNFCHVPLFFFGLVFEWVFDLTGWLVLNYISILFYLEIYHGKLKFSCNDISIQLKKLPIW